MTNRELSTEIFKAFNAMEQLDDAFQEYLYCQIPEHHYSVLWERYMDVCSCVYRTISKAHEMERMINVNDYKKDIDKINNESEEDKTAKIQEFMKLYYNREKD